MVWVDAERKAERWRVQAMADLIAHRGPDDEGFFIDGAVALGHRRLSIVDLGGGHQPMSNEDGSVWIAFNGEVYNHEALRPQLEAVGHRYATRSDTETIVHLHEQYGPAAAARLRGMFAYAIWDSRRRELTLARDHTGVKPLYYAQDANGSLVFASEIKSVVAAGLVAPVVDPELVEEYFATGHISGSRTLLKGVYKLQPGHSLVWREGRVALRAFWQLGDDHESTDAAALRSPERAAPEFWDRFVDSVRSQLMSDVPLGVFLSGGLDSSLIVAAMRAIGVSGIRSFSVGYREDSASELPFARRVAANMETEHHEVIVDGAQFFEDLPMLTWQRDLPLTFSASIPLYHLSRLARDHVTVVLTGEGSDELFAGYGRYPRALINQRWAARLDRLMPAGLRNVVSAAVRGSSATYAGDRLARSFLVAGGGSAQSCLEPFAEWYGAWRDELFQPEVPRGHPFGDLPALLDEGLFARRPLEALLRYDQSTYMEELLMKQDAMSMAASLESRVPFLDHYLVEWAAGLPATAKLSGMTGKALVREAARAHLPAEVVRGPKRGFLVPLGQWMRSVGRPTVDGLLRQADASLFRSSTVARLLAEHHAGRDHTARLWRLVAFECWRQFVLPRLEQLAAVTSRRASVADLPSPTQ